MSQIRPPQTSFSGGEYSQSLYSRTDIEKYKTGLKRCRNFIVHPHGGVSNRPGFKWVAESKTSSYASIVQDFVFSSDQAYVLEYGNQYVRFYTAGSQITMPASSVSAWHISTAYTTGNFVSLAGGTVYYAINDSTGFSPDSYPISWSAQSIYEVPTPYVHTDLADLRFESSADTIFITHPDYKPRTLSRYDTNDWRLEEYSPDDGPFMPENLEDISMSVASVSSNSILSSTSAYFVAGHVGALFKLRHYIDGDAVSVTFSSATTSSSIYCFTTWRIITHGTWTGKIRIEKSTDSGTTWTILRTFSSTDDFNANTSGTEDVETNTEPFLVRLNMYEYTSGSCNVDLTTDPFYQEGIGRVTTYNSTTSVNMDVIQRFGTTASTTSWFEGSWSDYRGYPGVSRFYQDRLCFSGTESEPMTVYMTQTGSYYSFKRHSTLLDTDGITINLPSRQVNAINGLVSLRDLIALTSSSEWTITPLDGNVLKPTGVLTKLEGYRGSFGVNPAVIGNECIFVQKNGKVIRNLGFELQSDSFTGSDLNILARHLFQHYTITDVAYQQDPDSILWCLRSDGKLLAMTYMKEQEVIAWSWHDTDGVIESICVIPGDGFDEIWVVVNRDNGRMIERMGLRMQGVDCGGDVAPTADNQIFMDSAVQYETENATEISGFSVIGTDEVVRITLVAHGYTSGQAVRLRNVSGMPELSGRTWIIGNVTTNTFDLITEIT